MFDLIKKEDGQSHEEWFINYCRKLETNTIETHRILSNDSYINWLITFSEKITSLSEESISINGNCSKEEILYISRLRYLYEVIRMYADKSYIAPYEIDGKYVYYIEYKGVVLEIGLTIGENNSCNFKRLDNIPNDIVVINFKSIKEDKNSLKNDYIKVRLSELSNHIVQLINNGIPVDEIRKTTEETIKLRLKKED